MKTNKAGIEKRFAKTKDYKKTLENIIETDKCPFCPENFKYHKNPILKKHKDWQVTENSWPYQDTIYHFIFIPDKHMTTFQDLTSKDFETVKYLVNWVIDKYKIKGGGLTLRFGDQNYTGATVLHLHFHLIVPKLKPNSKIAKTVNFPIG